MESWLVVILIAVALLAVATKVPTGRYEFRRRELMSGAERKLFALLRAEVPPPFVVLAQVRLADLIEPRVSDRRARRAAFSTISQKHVDFVIYDPSRNVVLGAIELDGPTHRGARSRKADDTKTAALASAGVALSRITTNEAKSRAAVAALVAAICGDAAIEQTVDPRRTTRS